MADDVTVSELRQVLAFPKTRHALANRSLQRPYPKLPRGQRRAVRRIFLFGLLHPDAMHYAIWGINDCGCSKGAIKPGCPRHDPEARTGS